MDQNDRALNKMKEFESYLKNIILETYGKFLPEDKISMLNISKYTTIDLLGYDSSEEVRGELLRRMLDDIIDMRVIKEVTLDDGNTITINYGYCLEDSLINYYAAKLSEKYHFNIDEVEGLSDDLETIQALYEKLGDKLDYGTFNEDAVKLLEQANIKEIIEKYDQLEVENYFRNVAKVAGIGELTKEEQNKLLKDATNRFNSITIIWPHEKKHLKYVDPYGEVHLTDISNSPKVIEYIQQRLASLGPDDKLDPEQLHHEIQKYYATEMELISTNDIKEEELNSKQVDMLEFMKSIPELNAAREADIMKHNSELTTHVLKVDNSVVATEDKDDHVEANIIKDGDAVVTQTVAQQGSDISSRLISKEEYIRLTEKLFNGEELSLEEKEALRRAAPVYQDEVYEEMQEKQNTTNQLKPKSPYDIPSSGFTLKTFALYFVVLSLLIATIVIIVLLR